MPPRRNKFVSLLQNLLFAQHVSGTIMPIIRSSRVIQMASSNHLYNSWAPDDGHNGARSMLSEQYVLQ